MSSFIVGLTGGIGSGKSTVSDMFEALGVEVVDADLKAREVVAIGSKALKEIHQRYGDNIIEKNGELNRKALRDIIFKDDAEKTWLNNLMHPLIREGIVAALAQAKSEYVILSAPLLFENGLEKLVDSTLVVDVTESIQQVRTSKRDGVDKAQVKAIIDSQIDRTKRLALANDVIDNSSNDLNALNEKVKSLHLSYLNKSKNR